MSRTLFSIAMGALSLAACSVGPDGSAETVDEQGQELGASPHSGVVFTESNAAEGNTVLAFRRLRSGELASPREYATGGVGTSASLGSQGAVALSENGRFLLVVNAGSDDITTFSVFGSELALRSRIPSGGHLPVSITTLGSSVYVLNAGESPNVSGFRLLPNGELRPLPGAIRALSDPESAPAQVGISPDGRELVVTEKATNAIETFRVGRSGALDESTLVASAGDTPFGFAFTPRGDLLVSEAKSGSVSSYRFDAHGDLNVLSAAIPDHQGAPCWVLTTPDSRFAYTANAQTQSISGYRVARDGSIALLDDDGVTGNAGANSKPLDMALDRSSHLYLLDGGNHAISEFQLAPSGELTLKSTAGGLPPAAAGIAAL